jgi:hypothetical protein
VEHYLVPVVLVVVGTPRNELVRGRKNCFDMFLRRWANVRSRLQR